MRLLLLGANGRTGRQVLRLALRDGDAVTALVRSRDRLADIRHERLDVRVGSPCDSDVLERLLPGHDVVISVLGPRWPTRAAASIYPRSATAIVDAMQRSEVSRLIVTSSALLFPSDAALVAALKWLVPSIVEGARSMEERIRGSDLDWTIARTSFLTNGQAQEYRLEAGGSPVSRAAVARFLHAEARHAAHPRQIVGLCG